MKIDAVLIFECSDSKFAIDVEKMIEIIEMVEIRPMPNSPAFLKGVINYRGKVVPICDLNFLFEGKNQKVTLNTPIIMVEIEGKLMGFMVETVIGVQSLGKEAKMPVSHIAREYIINAFEYQENVLLIIDLAKVFKVADKEISKTSLGSQADDNDEALDDTQKPIMHERAISLSRVINKKQKKLSKYICFGANKEKYGLNIDFVDSVLTMQKVHWVPGLPNFVPGIFNKRGEIVSIIDFSTFIGLAGTKITQQSGLIVIKNEGMETALLVDDVIGVIDVCDKEIQPPPAVLTKEQVEYIEGEVETKKGLLVIVNAAKLLNAKRLTVFEAIK